MLSCLLDFLSFFLVFLAVSSRWLICFVCFLLFAAVVYVIAAVVGAVVCWFFVSKLLGFMSG